jgi:hypothetical protein
MLHRSAALLVRVGSHTVSSPHPQERRIPLRLCIKILVMVGVGLSYREPLLATSG